MVYEDFMKDNHYWILVEKAENEGLITVNISMPLDKNSYDDN